MSYSEPGSRDPIDCAFKFSAIVPTHNRARYIAEALDSLLGQHMPFHELIVIDDASTDETSDVLAGYRDQARIIELTANSGKAAALNMAIPLATGDYIWLFDDDDVALPDALSRHIELLTERDDVDFTYSDTYHTQDSDNIWNRDAWALRAAGYETGAFSTRNDAEHEHAHTRDAHPTRRATAYRTIR